MGNIKVNMNGLTNEIAGLRWKADLLEIILFIQNGQRVKKDEILDMMRETIEINELGKLDESYFSDLENLMRLIQNDLKTERNEIILEIIKTIKKHHDYELLNIDILEETC